MLSFTFINSHSQENDTGPKDALVCSFFWDTVQECKTSHLKRVFLDIALSRSFVIRVLCMLVMFIDVAHEPIGLL